MVRKLVVLLAWTLVGAPIASAADLGGSRLHSGVLPYEAQVARAAKQLGVPTAFVLGVAEGMELLYQRRYRDCRAFFTELEQSFPGTAVSPVAELLIWQALMLENFDFRYDDAYRASTKLAREKLGAAMKQPGQEGWEHLMMTVVSGIESIHAARQGRYLPALTLAFEAIDQVERTRARAPDFVDLRLADGMYAYWRTVVTQRAKGIPDFGDKREEGMAQITEVIRDGIFLGPAARLAMAFSWIEERKHDHAVGELSANKEKYPNNVINELILGMTRIYAKDYAGAQRELAHVLELDPTNRRAHYLRGVAWMRAGDHAKAEEALRRYLGSDHLETYQRSAAHVRLGEVLVSQQRHGEAVASYEAAVKLDGDAAAKAALERLKKLRKEGKATW